MDSLSAKYFVINKGDYASGVNSLEFAGFGKGEQMETERAIVLSPEGAIDLPAGEYQMTCKVYWNKDI